MSLLLKAGKILRQSVRILAKLGSIVKNLVAKKALGQVIVVDEPSHHDAIEFMKRYNISQKSSIFGEVLCSMVSVDAQRCSIIETQLANFYNFCPSNTKPNSSFEDLFSRDGGHPSSKGYVLSTQIVCNDIIERWKRDLSEPNLVHYKSKNRNLSAFKTPREDHLLLG